MSQAAKGGDMPPSAQEHQVEIKAEEEKPEIPWYCPAPALMYATRRFGEIAWSLGDASLVSIGSFLRVCAQCNPELANQSSYHEDFIDKFNYLNYTKRRLANFLDTNSWWVSSYAPFSKRIQAAILKQYFFRQKRVLYLFLFSINSFNPNFLQDRLPELNADEIDMELGCTVVNSTIDRLDYTYAQAELRREIIYNLSHPITLLPRKNHNSLKRDMFRDLWSIAPDNHWELDRQEKLRLFRLPSSERITRERCPLRVDRTTKSAHYIGEEIGTGLPDAAISYLETANCGFWW